MMKYSIIVVFFAMAVLLAYQAVEISVLKQNAKRQSSFLQLYSLAAAHGCASKQSFEAAIISLDIQHHLTGEGANKALPSNVPPGTTSAIMAIIKPGPFSIPNQFTAIAFNQNGCLINR